MKKAVETSRAPGAIGPYSQGVICGNMIYVSGQIPVNPDTGVLEPGGIGAQTERAIDNVAAILEAAGSGLAHVVKTTVFLRDMKDFAAMNEVYARRFEGSVFPARAAIEISALPKNARIEIEAVACIPEKAEETPAAACLPAPQPGSCVG